MSDTMTLYKLMVLFILSHVDFPITTGQLTEFILGKGYTDYIVFSETLGELTEAELISAEKHSNTTEYTITEEGGKTIGYFEDRIPLPIRDDIRSYLKNNHFSMKAETSVTADYYKTVGCDYAVRCRIREGSANLIDLTITVPTEVQAEASAIKWKSKCQELYSHIMQELL